MVGRNEEALGFADRAAGLGWRNATLAYHRGMILRQLGRDDAARTALADTLAITPYFSPLHAPRAEQFGNGCLRSLSLPTCIADQHGRPRTALRRA